MQLYALTIRRRDPLVTNCTALLEFSTQGRISGERRPAITLHKLCKQGTPQRCHAAHVPGLLLSCRHAPESKSRASLTRYMPLQGMPLGELLATMLADRQASHAMFMLIHL